ncbi:MAG: hypothetical protein ACYCQJ_13835 [Nitrososphaerales archaeon]
MGPEFQCLRLIPCYAIPDLSGPLPQALVLELYRRKYLSADELLQKCEQIENPLDTIFKLWKLGLDVDTTTRMTFSLRITKDLVSLIEEEGDKLPNTFLRVAAEEEEFQEWEVYSHWKEVEASATSWTA